MTKIPHLQGSYADNMRALNEMFEEWDSPVRRLERKRFGAKCGHIVRRLNRNEPLTGKVLEFALSILGEKAKGVEDPFFDGVVNKLKTGEQLHEYEFHMLVDVWLLHARLGD